MRQRILRLTKNAMERGLGIIEARQWAEDHCAFEVEVQRICTSMKPGKHTLGGK